MNAEFKQWLKKQEYYKVSYYFALKDWKELQFKSWSWEEVKIYYSDDIDERYKLAISWNKIL
jgi:hypothetical protein